MNEVLGKRINRKLRVLEKLLLRKLMSEEIDAIYVKESFSAEIRNFVNYPYSYELYKYVKNENGEMTCYKSGSSSSMNPDGMFKFCSGYLFLSLVSNSSVRRQPIRKETFEKFMTCKRRYHTLHEISRSS